MQIQVRKAPRPLIHEALEYGLKNLYFEGSFISKIRDEGRDLTLVFAEKHYDNIYAQENLEQSFDIVLAMLNFSLVVKFGSDVDKTARFLAKEEFYKLLGYAWRELKEMSRKMAYIYKGKESFYRVDLSKKIFSVNTDSDQVIQETFDEEKRKIEVSYQEERFFSWINNNFLGLKNGFDAREYYDRERVLNSLALSFVLRGDEKFFLDAIDIVRVSRELSQKKVSKALGDLEKRIPDEFLGVFKTKLSSLNIFLNVLLKDRSTKRMVRIRESCLIDPTGMLDKKRNQELSLLLRDETFDFFLRERHHEIDENEVVLLSKAFFSKKPSEEQVLKFFKLYGVLAIMPIDWSIFSWRSLISLASGDHALFVIHRVIKWADKNAPDRWWISMPPEFVFLLAEYKTDSIKIMFGRVTVPLVSLKNRPKKFLFLLSDNDFYSFWLNGDMVGENLFSYIVRYARKYFKWSDKRILDYIYGRVVVILERLQKISGHKKSGQNVFCDNEFRRSIRIAFKKHFRENDYKKLRAKLKKAQVV